MKTKSCRGCGAPITFVSTKTGKISPVNPELLHAKDCKPGTVLITYTGETVKVTAETSPTLCGYVSHFATCPQANMFRNS